MLGGAGRDSSEYRATRNPRSGSSLARICIAPDGPHSRGRPSPPSADRGCAPTRLKPHVMKTVIKPLLSLLLLLIGSRAGFGAVDPVKWSASLDPAGLRAGEGGRVVVSAA